MKIFLLAAVVISASLVGRLSAAATKRVGGSDDTLESIVSYQLFEEMLKHRNSPFCPARNFYTYDAFINASSAYPDFGTIGDLETRKREVVAFLSQSSHETTGGWEYAPDGPYAWGYCYVEQDVSMWDNYCVPDPEWPCVHGKSYHGRGPMQLAYNYNYGAAGEDLGLDLLSDPDLVATDPVISFETAMWFWMTPQSPKPSCHDVITGGWTPTWQDIAARRLPGYGLTTNIINGAQECGFGWSPSQVDRIGYYKRFCDVFGIDPGDNLDCYHQRPYPYGLTQQAK